MPTPLKEIFDDYTEEELESFAKDKIEDFQHLRLPKSVLVDELYSLLTDQSYLKEKLAFRSPPSYDILHTLLNSRGYEHEISGFKSKVLKKTDELVTQTNTEDRVGSGEDYDLYIKMLRTAWFNEEEIKPNEANLLETLRSELDITFEEHFILEHHQDIKDLWDRGDPFKRERNHLLQSGIIFTSEDENTYIVPEEIAYQILDLWGIELDHEDYSRLLDFFQKDELEKILDEHGLYVSGTKDELIDRIISNHIPVSSGIDVLNKTQIRRVCKKAGCKSSGSKEQIIERLVQYIQYDRDLESDEESEPEITLPDEDNELNEDEFHDLFDAFTSQELSDALSELPDTLISGAKDEKVERLWNCSLAEESLLDLFNKSSLREVCDAFDLNVSGTKDEIIERLVQHQQEKDVELQSTTAEDSDDESDDKTESESEQSTEQSANPQEIPKYDDIQDTFPFLNQAQHIILASLIEFESISEQEIDRIVARYDLPWLFPNQEMQDLMSDLKDNGYDIIEKNEVQEHNWYKAQHIEELPFTS